MPNPLIDALHTALRRPTLLALGLLIGYWLFSAQLPATQLLFLIAAVASVYAAHRAADDHPGAAGTILLHVSALIVALVFVTLDDVEHMGLIGVLGCASVLAAPCLHARDSATSGAARATSTTLLVMIAVVTVMALLGLAAAALPN